MPKKHPKRIGKASSDNSLQNLNESRESQTSRNENRKKYSSTFFSDTKKKINRSKIVVEKTLITKEYLQELGIDNMEAENYIPSSSDKPKLVRVRPVNILKKVSGRGLYAVENIPAGTCLGEYTGNIFASKEKFKQYLIQNPGADQSYTMDVGSKIVDGATKGNITRYINCSDVQENVEFVLGMRDRKKVCNVMTMKEIPANTQILVDYNSHSSNINVEYYFLNPEDGIYSANELHKMYSQSYMILKMTSDIGALNVKKEDHLYATIIGKTILENKLLSELNKDQYEPAVVDLLLLKTDELKTILDFDATDNFTPLMLACYAGQLENVRWLLQTKVNVNRQQHHSGNCPLFLALEGYSQAEASEKAEYIKITQLLIKSKANIFAHDKEGSTFLHRASSILSDEDFKKIISLIKQQEHIVFNDLFSYIDKDDFDILLCCIKNKSIEKVKTLLNLYVNYFDVSFKSKNKQSNQSFFNEFKEATQNYNDEDKEILLELLSMRKYKVSDKLLEELYPSDKENDISEIGYRFG